MRKSLRVGDLKVGMKYTKPVYVDDRHLLTPEMVPLKQKDLDRLAKWGVTSVYTEGSLVTDATVLKQATEAVTGILDATGGSDLLQAYKTMVMQLDRILSEIQFNRMVDRKEIEHIIEQIMKLVGRNPNEMLAFVLRGERAEPSPGMSAVNCAILSVIVGTSMKLDPTRLAVLAAAATLHDVGMTKVPDAIRLKSGNLTEVEMKTVRTHTLYSYKIVTKQLRFPEEVGSIALQHHERWDGKGYPRKLAGKAIALEARIVSVADAFEAMVKERPYRSSMIAYSAMRQLLNDNSRRFDSEILKIFITSMGIYPLGSFVLLNDGRIGGVIKTTPSVPLRPVVRILFEKGGVKMGDDEGELIDLAKETSLFIARVIDPKTMGSRRKP